MKLPNGDRIKFFINREEVGFVITSKDGCCFDYSAWDLSDAVVMLLDVVFMILGIMSIILDIHTINL
ncbi:MAG: hypothetical protein Q4F92_03035 [Acidaminococcus sp.]|nr:hypothetical protein [Acidaminococcus sp.]MDO5597304.1 hypothetical protein [Acidaminococcus sp.]